MVMAPWSFITPPPPGGPLNNVPSPELLSEMVQSVSVNTPALKIPPPPSALYSTKPCEIVIPEIETVTALELMRKIRNRGPLGGLRCTVKRLAPGPVMVRFLSITNSPLVRVTVVTLGAKLIVSPGEASRIACRNDPGPLSLMLVTVMVAAGVLVAVQLSVLGLYLPPVFISREFSSSPPQTIISLPVHTAV